MGLLSETNEQYYGGQQAFIASAAATVFIWTGDTTLIATTSTSNTNFKLKVNNVTWTEVSVAPVGNQYRLTNTNEITTPPMAGGETVVIELLEDAKWENFGSYSYIKMADVIDNFMVGYVGEGKLITYAKRTDVLFHAKRGLQEFSYDTLKSIKSQELTIPDSLSLTIPQDYVNYVKLSWIDGLGVKHTIYPTQLTSSPWEAPIQSQEGQIIQDNFGDNVDATSVINESWQKANTSNITGVWPMSSNNPDLFMYDWFGENAYGFGGWYGQRYGGDPVNMQMNGWFNIDNKRGTFNFSSDLKNKLILLEYVSDGLAYDLDSKVPKLAEEAMYQHLLYSIMSTRRDTAAIAPQYKRQRYASLRNAKIRLSNIKLDEIVQVMRNKSKWIKH